MRGVPMLRRTTGAGGLLLSKSSWLWISAGPQTQRCYCSGSDSWHETLARTIDNWNSIVAIRPPPPPPPLYMAAPERVPVHDALPSDQLGHRGQTHQLRLSAH